LSNRNKGRQLTDERENKKRSLRDTIASNM
jgi:hypothetical protein